jgi:hypothetical protein
VILAQFVERIGRRPLWIFGTVGILGTFANITGLSVSILVHCVLPLTVLTFTQGAFATSKNAAVGTAVIPFLYIFYIFYNASFSVLGNLCELGCCVIVTPSRPPHEFG